MLPVHIQAIYATCIAASRQNNNNSLRGQKCYKKKLKMHTQYETHALLQYTHIQYGFQTL